MRKVLFLSVLVVLFTGLSMGQAYVVKDNRIIGVASDADPEYISVSATDIDLAYSILNYYWGCGYPVGDLDEWNARVVQVFTPSGNEKQSINGPAVHAVWAQGDDVCTDEPVTWGYGELGWTSRWSNQGPAFRVTASGYLPDDPDMCPGDILMFSMVYNSQAKGGDGNENIDLVCPE